MLAGRCHQDLELSAQGGTSSREGSACQLVNNLPDLPPAACSGTRELSLCRDSHTAFLKGSGVEL